MEIGHLKEFLNVLSVRAKSERNVGLTLKISALVTHYGDQFTLLTQVILYFFIFTLKNIGFRCPIEILLMVTKPIIVKNFATCTIIQPDSL